MSSPVRKRQSTRFCGRSYMAFLFMPELPLENWLADLDSGLERSPGFFVGRPVVLDLSALQINSAEIAKLIASLQERDIRIMGLEGVDPAMTGPGLPPLLRGGRATSTIEMLQHRQQKPTPKSEPASEPAPEAPVGKQQIGSLVLQDPVRSGQSVVFKEGDVTVLGSVASGAEIVAGGSIHVYGTLRGRAMAGSPAMPKHASSAARSRPSCWRSTATTEPPKTWTRAFETAPSRLGSTATMMITALN